MANTFWALFVILLSLSVAFAGYSDIQVYGDSLNNKFQTWRSSGGSLNLADGSNKKDGTYSLSFNYASGGGAMYLFRSPMFIASDYPTISLYFNVGSSAKSITFYVAGQTSETIGNGVPLTSFVSGGTTPVNTWVSVTINLSNSAFGLGNLANTVISGFYFQSSSSGTAYFDDITLVSPAFSASVSINVNAASVIRPINTDIYGVNFGTKAQIQAVGYTANRKGGNSETGYNYLQDINSAGSDWVFMSTGNTVADVSKLPNGSTSDSFVLDTISAGAKPLMQLTTIGYIFGPNRGKMCSFSVAKYGPQSGSECTVSGYASWCDADCGNGIKPDGVTYVTGNNPLDTAFVADQTWQLNYINHMRSVAGSNVNYFLLDNECGIWDGTHRDIHPQPTTYDEQWNKMKTYAAAVKAAYSQSVIFGPVSWGWCEYWYSATDSCQAGSDSAAHGNTNFSVWLMQNINNYYTTNGVKLVDYFDIHYYPAPDGASGDGNDATSNANRLSSVRSLYDPLYQEDSWIGVDVGPNFIQLIPRFKKLIATYASWMKFSISEYNWGADTLVTSALAQAEVLAIFAREGVDLATRFTAPASGSIVEDAFKLLMNYDGTKTKYSGSAITATSTNVNMVPAYAAKNGNTMWVLVFNKDPSSTYNPTVTLSGATLTSTTGKYYRLGNSWRLSSGGTVTVSNSQFTIAIPPYSVYLFVFSISTTAATTTAATTTHATTAAATTTHATTAAATTTHATTAAATTTHATTAAATTTHATTAAATTTHATTAATTTTHATTAAATTTHATTAAATTTHATTAAATTTHATTAAATTTHATTAAATTTHATTAAATTTHATTAATTTHATTAATSAAATTTTGSTTSPAAGTITFTTNSGTGPYWYGVTISGSSQTIQKAELFMPGAGWANMNLTWWGDWEFSTGHLLVLPFGIRLTSSSGSVLTMNGIISSLSPTGVFYSDANFATTSEIYLTLNSGSNAYWIAIGVHGGHETTTNVELFANNAWQATSLQYWGEWAYSTSTLLTFPMSVRLTSAAGHKLVLGNLVTSATPSATFDTLSADYTSSPISITVNSGTNTYWVGLGFSGASETLSKVEVYQQTSWQAMDLTYWGDWEFNNNHLLTWPLSLRLTGATSNRVLTLPAAVTSGTPSAVYSNLPNFPTLGNINYGPQPATP